MSYETDPQRLVEAFYDYQKHAKKDLAGEKTIEARESLKMTIESMLKEQAYAADRESLSPLHAMLDDMTAERMQQANELYGQFLRRHLMFKR